MIYWADSVRGAWVFEWDPMFYWMDKFNVFSTVFMLIFFSFFYLCISDFIGMDINMDGCTKHSMRSILRGSQSISGVQLPGACNVNTLRPEFSDLGPTVPSVGYFRCHVCGQFPLQPQARHYNPTMESLSHTTFLGWYVCGSHLSHYQSTGSHLSHYQSTQNHMKWTFMFWENRSII